MKKIAWITDTTASLDTEFIKKWNIHVVPLNILFGDEVLKEEHDITTKEFYKRMAEESISPTTSQPAIGEFVKLYEQLKTEYDVGIAIHASSQLSGTGNTSRQAAEMAGFELISIDSKIGSYPLGEMVRRGVLLEEEGKTLEEITQAIEEMTTKTELYLIPSNLEQLKKSGRLSNGQSILATLLKVNLIIKFEDGKVVLHEKIRTAKKVKAYIEELIAQASTQTGEIAIIHGDDEEEAAKWVAYCEQTYPNIVFKPMLLCPVAGVHTGKGAIGFSWMKQ